MTNPYPPEFVQHIKDFASQLEHGCGNSACIINQSLGMHTNGPCRCRPSDIARDLQDFHAYLERRFNLVTNQPK